MPQALRMPDRMPAGFLTACGLVFAAGLLLWLAGKLWLRLKKSVWNKRLHAFTRRLRFLFQYLVLEKPRGLDFTMRELALLQESKGRYSGYSKTDERHLRAIFDGLSYQECSRFLDIGCGKGVVLREAAR
ncbi:MAG: hypothetical protein Q4C65_01840, partial [Eubacteriales bacterium]|nr:hypothetical protein [Eubacteriales bacterium]